MKIAGHSIEYNSKEFKEIFERLFPTMCLVAVKFLNDSDLSKDVVQDSFVKLWEKEQKDFEDERAFTVYMYVLVKNGCISQLRKDSKLIPISLEKEIGIPDQEFVNEVLIQETYKMLYSAISELSSQTQQVLKLTLKGYKNQDIVNELNVSLNTVKTVKKRAYKALRDKLGSNYADVFLIILHFF